MRTLLMTLILLLSSCWLQAADGDFADLQKRAESGDPQAMCDLGVCYMNKN